MNASRLAAAAVLASLTAACAQAPATAPVDTARVADEVKAAIHVQVDAYAARDPAKAASIVSDDLVTMFHGAPNTTGKTANTESMRAQMADPALKLSVSNESVDVALSGDMAVYHATYSFTYTNPQTKQPATEVGNWVAIFRRQKDGTMRMSKDMVLDTPAG